MMYYASSVFIKSIAIFVFIVLIANVTIFCAATYEYAFGDTSDEWLTQTQRMNSTSDGVPVIMLHGFNASPFEFKPLALKMAELGFRVTIPLLPFQTRSYFSYRRGGWAPEEMYSLVRDIMDAEYIATGKKPILIGSSMGGTIASALCIPSRCQRLVLIAPFFSLKCCEALANRLVYPLEWILPVVPKYKKGQINDPSGYAIYEPGSRFISIESFRKLRALASLSKTQASHISVPTLVFASANDAVADSKTSLRVLSGNKFVQFRWVSPSANHILLYDFGYREIIEEIIRFSRSN